jgi:4-oxalocrotonate tautomerase
MVEAIGDEIAEAFELHDVLVKDPAITFVFIDEVDTEIWGVAGEPVSTLRARPIATEERR